MIWRLIYGLVSVLVLAGIVHIAIVLLIPRYGTQDAYAVLSRQTDQWSFTRLENTAQVSPLADFDPFFAYGVCRFDLRENGLWIEGSSVETFWSATVLDEDGTVVYSLNSRTSIDGKLNLVLLDPVRILRLREIQPTEIENSIVVEANIAKGFLVVRFLQPDESWAEVTERFMRSVECRRYSPQQSALPPDAQAPAATEDQTGE